jgi:hypothetical protein
MPKFDALAFILAAQYLGSVPETEFWREGTAVHRSAHDDLMASVHDAGLKTVQDTDRAVLKKNNGTTRISAKRAT